MRGRANVFYRLFALILISLLSTNISFGSDGSVNQPQSLDSEDSWIEDLFGGIPEADKTAFTAKITKGFEVSENALGDMNQDGIINIWDLLRIRNIHIGIGNPATAYEEDEGDLNQDLTINNEDIYLLFDILIQLEGIPHVIDSIGGSLNCDEFTVTIPPGAVDSITIMSIRSLSNDVFAEKYNLDLFEEGENQAWLTASFEMDLGDNLLKSPQIVIEPENIPPCSLRHYNGLWGITRNLNQDGQVSLVPISDLEVNEDSISLRTISLEPPIIDSILVRSSNKFFKYGENYKEPLYPGDLLTIFSQDNNITSSWIFFRNDSYEYTSSCLKDTLNNGLLSVIPFVPPGIYNVRILNTSSQEASDPAIIEIAALQPPPNNPDSIITDYFETMISIINEFEDSISVDINIPEDIRQQFALQHNDILNELYAAIDSIPNSNASYKDSIAALIVGTYNALNEPQANYNSPKNDCWKCIRRASLGIAGCAISPITGPFAPAAAAVCAGNAADFIADNTCADCEWGCDWCCVSHLGTPGRWEIREGTCPNCLKRKVCVPLTKRRYRYKKDRGWPDTSFNTLIKGAADSNKNALSQNSEKNIFRNYDIIFPVHAAQGLIVSIADYQLPFGANVVINESGGFTIPCVPRDYDITMQIYDPLTGHFDPNVGSVHTPQGVYDELQLKYPLFFSPDTSVTIFGISVGEYLMDTVTLGNPRYEYSLFISPDYIGDSINIGFWGEENMTLWIQDPDDEFIYRDSSVNYYLKNQHIVETSGTYKFTVTYGVSGGKGAFELGVNNAPLFPISRLKGNICGLISENISQYNTVGSISVLVEDSLTIAPNAIINMHSGHNIINNGYISCDRFNSFAFSSNTLTNNNSFYIEDGNLNIVSGLTINFGQDARFITNDDTLTSIIIESGGLITHTRGITSGVSLMADSIEIKSGGKIEVNGKGYRGSGQDGWNQDYGETYPGMTAATWYCGGSHGGYGGQGTSGGAGGPAGTPGDAYGSVDNPTTLGAGGSDEYSHAAGNGGGIVIINADKLIISGGEIRANGDHGEGYSYGGGGAGGSININTRVINGNGIVSAYGGYGGTYGSSSGSSAGGGGRIAVHWEEGDISGIGLYTAGGVGNQDEGGSGTVYINGPDTGENGRLIIYNFSRNGAYTPLPGGRYTFSDVEIKAAGKLNIGDYNDSLIVNDSIIIDSSNSYMRCDDSTVCSTSTFLLNNGGKSTLGSGMDLNISQLRVLNSSGIAINTDISFDSASDVSVNGSTSYIHINNKAAFSIPYFNTNNFTSGYFWNWGTLNVGSDSIIINSGFWLGENGILNQNDSIGFIQVFGKLVHNSHWVSILYDSYLDTGLVLFVDTLIVESGGVIDASYCGYRGIGNNGWDGSRSETYDGYLGASYYSGGSHGGLGGADGSGYPGDPGEIFDSETNPRWYGAGGGGTGTNSRGGNGGGSILINANYFALNGGLIYSNGQAGLSYAGGGSGGTININTNYITGTGNVQARGGNGGTYGSSSPSGGGGGGRIAVYWGSGSIAGWNFSVSGGNGQGGDDGSPGTIYTEQITPKNTEIGGIKDESK